MTDIMDEIVRMPAPGLRLSDEAGDAVAAFVRAIRYERDSDTAAGIAAAVVMILISRQHHVAADKILSHMNRVIHQVYRTWSSRK